jgi:hypothetical protein
MFPDAKLEKGVDSSEGEETGQFLRVIRKGETLLVLHRERGKRSIFSVEVLAPGAVGPEGVRVGEGLDKLDLATASCGIGEEEASDTVHCAVATAPNVFFIGSAEGWRGVAKQLPAMEVRARTRIEKILWQPHR